MEYKKDTYNDEIDLLLFMEMLWHGKWKIIIFIIIFFLFGLIYSFQKSNSFIITSKIQTGKPSNFVEFMPINNVLDENQLLLSENNSNGYIISPSSIFKSVLDEFSDYEELMHVLSEDSFVENRIKNFEDSDKQKILYGYAKSFTLSPPTNASEETKETFYSSSFSDVSFTWHDVDNGILLLESAFNLSLKNVQKNLLRDIEKLALSIDLKKQRELEKLQNEINIIKKGQELENARRIQYLIEQSLIAKELDIDVSQLDANALLQTQMSSLSLQSENNSISVAVDPSDFPFYLRGYLAIDKEIAIINNRSADEQLLAASGYNDIRKKILLLENDKSSSQLKKFLKIIESNNPKDWVNYNFKMSNSKSLNNFNTNIILSILLGFIAGVIYVIISNSINKRKQATTNF